MIRAAIYAACAILAMAICLSAQVASGVQMGGTEAREPPAEPLQITYFFSPTCLKCQQAGKLISALEEKYGRQIHVERLDIHDPANMERMVGLEDQYGSSGQAPPKVFIGKQSVVGLEAISARLDEVIAQELPRRGSNPVGEATPATGPSSQPATQPAGGSIDAATPPGAAAMEPVVGSRLIQRFASYRLGAVAVAGLVDGINPCAFTTIVFLLSMLAYLGKSKHQIATVGATFTIAVFATYFAIGLGLFQAIKVFAVNRGITLTLTYVIAALAFILGVWSLVDGIRFRHKAAAPKGTLGLPKSIKRSIHMVIRTGLKTRHLVMGTLAVGFLVSVLESLCTGQVYLPTIMLVIQTTPLRWQAMAFLLLYNVMFILPLAALVLVTYWGVGSQRIGDFVHSHVVALKCVLAAVFVGLGVLLLASV